LDDSVAVGTGFSISHFISHLASKEASQATRLEAARVAGKWFHSHRGFSPVIVRSSSALNRLNGFRFTVSVGPPG
jgi:hypothetical protein